MSGTGRGSWAAFVATGAAGLGTLALLATVDPHEPGHYPVCPFLASTGLYCPGCGSLRALHALSTGDPVEALARNPLVVMAAPLMVVAFAGWGVRITGRPAPHPTRVAPRWIWLLLVGVLAFAVARNLPGWDWLSPA
jgi:hypothetical protein